MRNHIGQASSTGRRAIQSSASHQETSAVIVSGNEAGTASRSARRKAPYQARSDSRASKSICSARIPDSPAVRTTSATTAELSGRPLPADSKRTTAISAVPGGYCSFDKRGRDTTPSRPSQTVFARNAIPAIFGFTNRRSSGCSQDHRTTGGKAASGSRGCKARENVKNPIAITAPKRIIRDTARLLSRAYLPECAAASSLTIFPMNVFASPNSISVCFM